MNDKVQLVNRIKEACEEILNNAYHDIWCTNPAEAKECDCNSGRGLDGYRDILEMIEKDNVT